MRIFFLLFILYVSIPSTITAQQFKRIFLFDSFVQAKITFRNHSVSIILLNYDASNKVMLFKQGAEMMELTNPEQIDTIFVGKRQFVPASKGFNEVIRMANGPVYIDWLLKDVNIGSKGALGAVTQGSVQNLQMSDLGLNGAEMYTPYDRQKKGSTDVYKRKNDNAYYILVEGKRMKVKTLKQLMKLFPAHAEQIKAYAKEKDLKDVQDVLDVLNYCLSFTR